MSKAPPSKPDGLTIRAVRIEDAAAITEMVSLPGFRFGTLRMPHSRIEQTQAWISGMGNDATNLVALLDGTVVGNAGLNRHGGRRSHAAGIGIGVHDDFTGRGIGRALMTELIDVADNWLNLRRLELNVYGDNAPAIALYESLGFRREGVYVDYAFRDGAYVDSMAMARIRG